MDDDPLIYTYAIGKRKPYDYDFGNRQSYQHSGCPFCDVDQLTHVFASEGECIWLKNRYPTLKDTAQTILIESSDHQGDISTYTREDNRHLLRFALHCFHQMLYSQQYQSVLWYKNFGPKSDGSLTHPHMQLVGLYHKDGYRAVGRANFIGFPVVERGRVEMNLSATPVQGYQEVNVVTWDNQNLATWADLIQKGTQYMRSVLSHGVDSYNLFFYPIDGGSGTCCKIIPRFYASPYFVGYKISQVDDAATLKWEAMRLRGFVTSGI